MIAVYHIDFYCDHTACHTMGESTYPTAEQFFSKEYSVKQTDEMAISFVNGYLEAKGLLGEVTPTNISYSIDFH